MDDRITQCVLGAHNRILADKHIEKESSIDMEIRPRNGITSESIVTLLLDIEDELDVDLDDYLPEIRRCQTIGRLIEIVEMACNDGKK